MGAHLFVLVAKVKTHAPHILAKLGPESRVQLASWGCRPRLRFAAAGPCLESAPQNHPLIGHLADDTPPAQAQYGRLNSTDPPQGREMAPIPTTTNPPHTNPPPRAEGVRRIERA